MANAKDSTDLATLVLGPAAASYLSTIERVVDDLPLVRYLHMDSQEFLELTKADLSEGMRVYWTEILYRAHFSASVSVVRTKRWLDGLLGMAGTANYVAFMACNRGFLESSADSFYSLGNVSFWLADLHGVVRAAVKGELPEPAISPDLENALIHFAHARRSEKGEVLPNAHRAKATTEYIASLADSGDERVTECYRKLCDATHPAVGSLLCNVGANAPTGSEGFGVTTHQDAGWIFSFGREYADVSARLMFFGVVAPLMILRLLNEFEVPSLHAPVAAAVDAESHPMWVNISARLADKRTPEQRLSASPEDLKET